ncbi:MAG: hypothetical protein KDA41_15375, partial [Planctomycetales bacterium]|nr:hypothetical protein [Planctomycetales bacterium]
QLQRLQTGHLKWATLEQQRTQIVAPGDLAALVDYIDGLEEGERTLVRATLSGVLRPDDAARLTRIEELLASRFLYAECDVSGLTPFVDDASWVEAMPPGVLQAVARRLCDLAAGDKPGRSPDEAGPEAASRALVELYRLLHEAPA